MQQNIGVVNALIRITLGLVGLAWSVSRMMRHARNSFPMLIALMSAMKVAEGITRFCPLKAMLNGQEKTVPLKPLTTNED